MNSPYMPSRPFHELGWGATRIFWGDTDELRPLFATHLPASLIEESHRQFRNTKRRDEWLAARLLLRHAFRNEGIAPVIRYHSNGRPYLNGTTDGFSISHSHGRVCIALTRQSAVGIDLEQDRARPFRLRHGFIHPDDLKRYEILRPEDFTIVWSAKESIYKILDAPGFPLTEIRVKPFTASPSGGQLEALTTGHTYTLHYTFLDAFVLTAVTT